MAWGRIGRQMNLEKDSGRAVQYEALNGQRPNRQGEGGYDGKRSARPTSRRRKGPGPRSPSAATRAEDCGQNGDRAPLLQGEGLRKGAARTRSSASLPRPLAQAVEGVLGGQRPPLYVSAKRTHRFFERFFAYHQHCQELMSFAESVCRWVRFGKRTHREGVFEGSLQESGYVLRITDEHGRRHGRSRTCRERMSVPLYKGSLLGPEKTWKRGRAFAIMGTSREAARLWPLGVFNNSWKIRPKYL
jgi:hypothetical protein